MLALFGYTQRIGSHFEGGHRRSARNWWASRVSLAEYGLLESTPKTMRANGAGEAVSNASFPTRAEEEKGPNSNNRPRLA